MPNIDKFIGAGVNVKIEVSVEDLKNFGRDIAKESFEALKKHDNKESDCRYITGNRVCEILDISRVTLWQWDKKGITKPIRMGNLKRYLSSDIDGMGIKKI